MSKLKDQLSADLVAAVKGQQEPQRTVLRSLLSAVKNAEIEKGSDLDDTELSSLLQKQHKQREESAAAYASRQDLAAGEQAEADLIASYLPKSLTDSELEKMVTEAVAATNASSMADMGKVMAELKPKTAGRTDGGRLADLVKRELG